MPRNRLIKVEFWSDEKIGKLSTKARLLFVATWTFADDTGICRANPTYLKNQIFPYDNNEEKDIQDLLNECSQQGLIRLFEHNNERYLEIVNFKKHQTINRPSKFRYVEDLQEVSYTTHGVLNEDSSLKVNVKEKENVKVNKKKYFDFVCLTKEEYQKLIDKFGANRTQDKIESLNNYIGKIGVEVASRKYKSHYHTILTWDNMAREKKNRYNPPVPEPPSSKPSPPINTNYEHINRVIEEAKKKGAEGRAKALETENKRKQEIREKRKLLNPKKMLRL